jgi:hypothetical protein
MEYFKNLCNYYFVKEIKKDTQPIIGVEINKEFKEFKEFKQKPFDVNSFDDEIINKINLIMFKK